MHDLPPDTSRPYGNYPFIPIPPMPLPPAILASYSRKSKEPFLPVQAPSQFLDQVRGYSAQLPGLESTPGNLPTAESTNRPDKLAEIAADRPDIVEAIGNLAMADERPSPDAKPPEATAVEIPRAADAQKVPHDKAIPPECTDIDRIGKTTGGGNADTAREANDHTPVAYTSERGDRSPEITDNSKDNRQSDIKGVAAEMEEWAARPKTKYLVYKHYGPGPRENIMCEGPEAQEVIDRFDAKVKEVRTKLIRDLPSEERGLDTAGVNKHTQGTLGIRPVTTIYLSPEGVEEYLHIKEALLGTSGRLPREVDGFYDRLFGLAVVRRDPEAEGLNGPEFTQSVAVHEQTHGAMERLRFSIVLNGFQTPVREGTGALAIGGLARRRIQPEQSSPSHHGIFLDEGLAEYERAKYLVSLGLKNGFFPDDESFINIRYGLRSIKIPSIFAYYLYDRGGVATAGSPSALAAAAIWNLADKDPRIPELLLYDQKNHCDFGPPELSRKAINAIGGHSLFERLDNLQETEADFVKGYRLIARRLRRSH